MMKSPDGFELRGPFIPVDGAGCIRAKYGSKERIVVGTATWYDGEHHLKAVVFNDDGNLVYAESLEGFTGLQQGTFS